jgi:hypothetical protein
LEDLQLKDVRLVELDAEMKRAYTEKKKRGSNSID